MRRAHGSKRGAIGTTAVAILLASFAAGKGAASDAAPTAMTEEAARAAVRSAAPEIARIRGLDFTRKVPVSVVADAEVRAHVLARAETFLPRAQLEARQRAWELLGVLPRGTDLLAEIIGVLEEQAGGYYDPQAKAFFFLDDMPAEIAPLLAAHELTHALDDQHHDLDARLLSALDDDDRTFALDAVHEGSAMLVMNVYMLRALSAGTLRAEDLDRLVASEAGRAEKLGAMPAVLRRELLGAYVLGAQFLLRGDPNRILGGVPHEDVERAFVRGPLSSEQILHPEKYWVDELRDDPRVLEPSDAGALLGRRWRRVADGVLGELRLGVLVGAPTPDTADLATKTLFGSAWTNQAAAGWRGDRWELWARGRRAVALIVTEWDSERDAEEFERGIERRDGRIVARSGRRVAAVAGDVGSRGEVLLRRLLASPAESLRAAHFSGRPLRSNRTVRPGSRTSRMPVFSSVQPSGSRSLP